MIVGITGPISSGKGKVMEFFRDLGFKHHSFSAEIRQVAKERGIEVNRPNLSKLGADLQKESPKLSVLGSRVIRKINEDRKKGVHNFVVDGIRDFQELYLFRLHEMDNKDLRFILIGVDAPQELRYKRLRVRGRAGEPKTFEEFKKIDDKEWKGGGGQEVGRCMKMADYIIQNDGTIEELQEKAKEIADEIL
jgi:dephospho-CoA kinase